jgi:hypothetical protein
LWVLGGGSIELLSKILGHSSVAVTQHYAHMRVDLFAPSAFCAMNVDLTRPAGAVVALTGAEGPTTATTQQDDALKQLA